MTSPERLIALRDAVEYVVRCGIPGRSDLKLEFMEGMGGLAKWVALHPLIICTKRRT